jgi:hypothetical protein
VQKWGQTLLSAITNDTQTHMDDKHSSSPVHIAGIQRRTPHHNLSSHEHNARLQAIQALQEEVECLRKDINALKQIVADKEFDMLVNSSIFSSLCIVLTHLGNNLAL